MLRKLNIDDYRSNEKKQRQVRNAHSVCRTILGKDDHEIIIVNGALSEFAAETAFENGFKRANLKESPSVIPATEEEDMKGKIDLWLDFGEDKKRVGLQVKCLSLDENPVDKVFRIENFDDIDNMLRSHPGFVSKERNYTNVLGSGEGMLRYRDEQAELGNDFDVAYVIIPSPMGRYPVFNSETGIPSQELEEDLVLGIYRNFPDRFE